MQSRSGGARGLVFGALMAALFIITAIIPVPFRLFMPIPLVLAYVRFGGRVALLTATVATIFIFWFQGPIQAIFLIPSGILPGLVFGFGFRNGLRPMTIGLSAVVSSFLGFAVSYVVMRTMVLGGQDPIVNAFQTEQMRELWNRFSDLFEQQLEALPRETAEQQRIYEMERERLMEQRENPAAVAWVLLPSGLFFGGAFTSWLNYKLCGWILPRFGHAMPVATPIEQFRLPMWLTWVYALSMFGMQFIWSGGSLLDVEWPVQVALNVFSTLAMVFAFAGFTVAYGILKRRGLSKGMSIGIPILAVLLVGYNLGLSLLILLAMWDSIFDFRKLGHGLFGRAKEREGEE